MPSFNHIKLSYIVSLYIDRKDLKPFHYLLDTYSAYNESILKHIHFIFVDDCSPEPITIPENYNLNYTLVRITSDIPWNQGGARNLGVHVAKSSKIVVTDLDHIFPESVFHDLVFRAQPSFLYMFNRIRNEKQIAPHFNTFFTSKSIYYKSLGVDEEFCGNYGHEDVFFVDMQRALGTKLLRFKTHTITSIEHKNTDDAHHSLIRDLEITKPLYDKKKSILKTSRDPFDAHSRLHLHFDWEIIEEHFQL